jgi:hypothetical protein
MPSHALITEEDRTLLVKVSSLLEELVETTMSSKTKTP